MRALLVLALALSACSSPEERRAEALAEYERAPNAPRLPSVAAAAPGEPLRERLIVGDPVTVDSAGLALAAWHADPSVVPEVPGAPVVVGPRAALFARDSFDAHALAPAEPGGMGRAPNTKTRHNGQRFLHRIEVLLAGDTPYRDYVRLVTALDAAENRPVFAVDTPAGRGSLAHPFAYDPERCRSMNCGNVFARRRSVPDPPAPDLWDLRGDLDLRVTVVLDRRGLDVFGRPGPFAEGCRASRAADATGPLFPRGSGLDLGSLDACLASLTERFGAQTVTIQPAPETPWREVAAVMGSLSRREGLQPALTFPDAATETAALDAWRARWRPDE